MGICNATDEFTLSYKSSDKQVQSYGMVNSGEKEFQKTNRWVTTTHKHCHQVAHSGRYNYKNKTLILQTFSFIHTLTSMT